MPTGGCASVSLVLSGWPEYIPTILLSARRWIECPPLYIIIGKGRRVLLSEFNYYTLDTEVVWVGKTMHKRSLTHGHFHAIPAMQLHIQHCNSIFI